MKGSILSVVVLILVGFSAGLHLMPLIKPNEDLLWESVRPSEIKCPVMETIPARSSTRKDSFVRIPKQVLDAPVPGIMCQRVKLETSCEVSFFGSKKIIYSSRPIPVTVAECIATDKSTFSPLPPSPSCKWEETVVTSATHIIQYEMSLHYDMYSSQYIGARFGECVRSPCVTQNGDGIWYTIEEDPGRCEMLDTTSWLDASDPVRIHGTYFKSKAIAGICKMELCGHLGYKFSDMEWVQFVDNVPHRAMLKAPPCDNKTLMSNHDQNRLGMLTSNVRDFIKEERCINALSILIRDSTISRIGLSSLVRTSPGKGYAYRFKDGVLERTSVNYVWADRLTFSKDNSLLGVDHDGQEIHWKDWIVADDKVLDGPNGISVNNDLITFPESDIYDVSSHEHLVTPLTVVHPWSDDKIDHNGDHGAIENMVVVGRSWTPVYTGAGATLLGFILLWIVKRRLLSKTQGNSSSGNNGPLVQFTKVSPHVELFQDHFA